MKWPRNRLSGVDVHRRFDGGGLSRRGFSACLARLAALVLLLLLTAFFFGCVSNTATGRSQLALISREHVNNLGEQSKQEFRESYGGDVDSQTVRNYVDRIGQRLAKQVREPEMRDLNWEFFVVDSSIVNAFALPGGKIYMSRGLLEQMENEGQLAGVLAHEIGHVTAEHGRERMSQQMAVQAGALAILAGAVYSDEDWMKVLGVGAQSGGTLFLLKFSRDQEAESDRLALRYMTALGYNPRDLIGVMRVLKANAGGGGGLEILKTHPNPDTRIELIQEIIQQNPQWRGRTWDSRVWQYEDRVLKPLSTLPPPRHPSDP